MHATPVSNAILLRQLRWRYATKQFDPQRTIPEADWHTLEETLVLTPSSYGLQPWKFIVVTNPETRRQLQPVSWNQPQITDGSHLVVFAIKKPFGVPDIDAHVRRLAEVRGMAPEKLEAYRKVVLRDLIEGPRRQQLDTWATCQIYIALGSFMTAAALLSIDTCPMEGIEPDQYDRILGLGPRRLATVVVCVAGYRLATDKYAHLPKVRFRREDVIEQG